MKLLMQTDEDCKECLGSGTIGEIKYRDSGSQYADHYRCEKCLGTGKELEWLEATISGNSIYVG